ncbi:unnamed protein product, partial [marine sediment metagenome]
VRKAQNAVIQALVLFHIHSCDMQQEYISSENTSYRNE